MYDQYENMHDRWVGQLPTILKPSEVMDILGLGKNTVYRLLATGQLRGIRVGRSWRVTSDAVEEFLTMR